MTYSYRYHHNVVRAVCTDVNEVPPEDREELLGRLYMHCVPSPDGRCMLWRGPWCGPSNPRLLATVHYRFYDLSARRFLYSIVYGPIPARRRVRVTCERPDCLHPDHILLSDQALVAMEKHAPSRELRISDVGSLPPSLLRYMCEQAARLWRAADGADGEDGDCVEWQGAFCGRGNPRLHLVHERREYDLSVRRLVYTATHGPIPRNGRAYARCGNQRCVAPAHVEIVLGREARGLSRDGRPLESEPRSEVA